MLINTKAFILSYLKYNDSSIIMKCYTEKFGFKSFILKNSYSKKNKKTHFLLILNEVELNFYSKKNNYNSLEPIKDLYQGYVFKEIHSNIYKSSMLTFISEILNMILKNEENPDPDLYKFILDCLISLDNKNQYFSDFHLHFLLNLSKYLGFHPLRSNIDFPFFNLEEGIFSIKSNNINKDENGKLWKSLICYDFSAASNCFNTQQRSFMLNDMLNYYQTHISSFRRPASLDILKLIFS